MVLCEPLGLGPTVGAPVSPLPFDVAPICQGQIIHSAVGQQRTPAVLDYDAAPGVGCIVSPALGRQFSPVPRSISPILPALELQPVLGRCGGPSFWSLQHP